jgi:signal transduction histidine kinase
MALASLRVFEQFYQIEEGRSRSSGGVGLGLAICRGFIEAHGGRIWAENRIDGTTGAVFSFWLPPKVLYHAEWQSGTPFDLQDVL